MNLASREIARLDRSLAKKGQDVVLSRMVSGSRVSVPCRAFVQGYQPHEITPLSGIQQGDRRVVMSLTQINAAGWPGTVQAPGAEDQRIPSLGFKDLVSIAGHAVAVQSCNPLRVDNVLVRLEVQVRG
jgi:hypothetical protein